MAPAVVLAHLFGLEPSTTYHFRVVASNATATSSGTDSTFTTPPPPPVNTSPPSVAGLALEGQTLSETHGSWTNNPTSYSYQWQRCDTAGGSCVAIVDASGRALALTAADVGHTIRVLESASNAGGSAGMVSSAQSDVVTAPWPPPSPPPTPPPIAPSIRSAPVISGLPQVGQILSSSGGSWAGTTPISYTYQWQRCRPACTDILGARGGSLTLTMADVDATVRVLVAASNVAGRAQAASAQLGPIAPAAADIKTWLRRQLAPVGKGARIGALLKNRGCTFSTNTLSAGRVTIYWYYVPPGARLAKHRPTLVATGKASFAGARRVTLTMKLTASGQRILNARRKLQLTATGTYTASGNLSVTATRTFTLKP